MRGRIALDVEVAGQHERHVAGDVPAVEVLLHDAQRGALEVLDLAEDVVAAVRVARERAAHEGAKQLVAGGVHRGVLLLVDGLELGGEQAKHRVFESVGVDLQPGVDLTGGEGVVIDGLVVAGERVDAGAAELAEHLVELVRHGERVGLLQGRGDLLVDRRALRGRGVALGVEQLDEAGLQRGLFGPVGGPEVLGAFKEHVLEVVGHAGLGLGVVLAAGAHDDGAEHLGALAVDAQHHGQAVGEDDGAHGERVVHGRGGGRGREDEGEDRAEHRRPT
jgi:hypothetical protein